MIENRSFVILITIICLSNLLTGCYTYVPYTKTFPPEVTLPPTATLIFVNRFDPDMLETDSRKKTNVYVRGRNEYVEGLTQGFKNRESYTLWAADTTLPGNTVEEPPLPLPQEMVRQICDTSTAAYLLTLDLYELYFERQVGEFTDVEGFTVNAEYYDLVLDTYTTLYDRDGRIVRKLKDENRIFHQSKGLFSTAPSLTNSMDNIKAISEEAGRTYVNKFYSDSVRLETQWFTNKPLQPAKVYYEDGKYDQALELLLPLAKADDVKLAGRAAFNIAVVYENLNKSAAATYWYQKAREKLGNDIPPKP